MHVVRSMLSVSRVVGLWVIGLASVVVGVGLVWRFVTPSASSAMLTGELVVMLGLVVLPAPAIVSAMLAGLARRKAVAGGRSADVSGSEAVAGGGDAAIARAEAADGAGGVGLRLRRDAA